MADKAVFGVSTNAGALLNNATRYVMKVPTYGGGITILSGESIQSAAGTHALYLVTMGTAGTARP